MTDMTDNQFPKYYKVYFIMLVTNCLSMNYFNWRKIILNSIVFRKILYHNFTQLF